MRTPYKIVKLEDLKLDKSKDIGFDIETCGFYQKIRLAQFYQEGDEYVQMVEWPDPILLAKLVNNYNLLIHNAHYEITTIQQQTDTRWIPKQYACTFLLARLALPKDTEFSLDAVILSVLGHDPYVDQHLDKKKLQKTNWEAAYLTEAQRLYAATDVYYMPQVYEAVKCAEEEYNYKLDILILEYCLDFQWNGMPLDIDRLNTRFRENEKKLKELACPINYNSWQQVRKWLDSDQSDDIALARMELNGNERAKMIRTCRKTAKQNSFIKKYLLRDDVLLGKFKPSARSGRLTSNDENLQQIPRKLKGCFSARPGKVLIYADYAQLELRTIAAIVNCTLMVQKFREGVDIHNFTAEMIFGIDFTKHQRQLTKTANFNFLYGGGIAVFISILIKEASIWLKDREAYSLRKKWRNLWSEIYAWQQRGITAWERGKIWSTPLGRQYVGKMMTDQLNIQNQGAGSEVAKLALHYMYPEGSKLGDLCDFIHDSYIWECDDDPTVYEPLAQIVADAMQESWTEMSQLFKVKDLPMPVNVRVGTNWGDIEDGHFIWELNQ